MIDAVNRPEVVAEIQAAFERYEAALVTNDVATLDELFWRSPHALRYGIGEELYGWESIAGFRAARVPLDLARTLTHVVITTYGEDVATANAEFQRALPDGSTQHGRQSQIWVRLPEGWRVVSAHVSVRA